MDGYNQEEAELVEKKEEELEQFKFIKAQIKERAENDQVYRDELETKLNKEKSKLNENY